METIIVLQNLVLTGTLIGGFLVGESDSAATDLVGIEVLLVFLHDLRSGNSLLLRLRL